MDVKYEYKVFRSGVYLGDIPYVKNDFEASQNINTAGVGITIEIGATADTSHEAVEVLTDENGVPLTTEGGEELTTERSTDLVGSATSNAMIRNGNDIEVWEFNTWSPNGVKVFEGYISNWEATFGSGGDGITIAAISHGTEMDNYLAQSDDTVDKSQLTADATVTVFDNPGAATWRRAGQSFEVSVTSLTGIRVKADTSGGTAQNVTMKVWPLANVNTGADPLVTVTKFIDADGEAEQLFSFTDELEVAPGTSYFYGLYPTPSGGNIDFSYRDADVYAGGKMYISSYGGGSGGQWDVTPIGIFNDSDMWFETVYSTQATNDPHSDEKPSDIIMTVLDSYNARGGTVTYTEDSIEDTGTGTEIDITFKLQTILEAVNQSKDASPAGFYWFVDPATSVLNYKQASATADHVLVLGNHIADLKLKATIEEVKNQVYFSGGDTGGGSNLFVVAEDEDSQEDLKLGLERISNNRVTDEVTGTAIAQSRVDEKKNEAYMASVTVFASTINTNLVYPGQTLGFAGWGNLVDSLILQIVTKKKKADYLELGVGILPKRPIAFVEQAQRALNRLETVDNPDTPA